MKRFLFISLIILASVKVECQTGRKTSETKVLTNNTGNNSKQLGAQTIANTLVQTQLHDTCLNKKFSIVFYIIQDSSMSITGTNIATAITMDVTPIVNLLNNKFSNICVSFENCSTVVIPNYPYNIWSAAVQSVVVNNWYTENTINFYLPRKILSGLCFPSLSYAYNIDEVLAINPTSRFKNIVVGILGSADPSVLHAMGHFFGLPHTFSETNPSGPPALSPTNTAIETKEYVNGTNCADHGDRFCDTDADPRTMGSINEPKHHVFCGYNGGEVDGNGDYYTPPVDNYMSYWLHCMCRYSQEQYNYMARKIVSGRMYLH